MRILYVTTIGTTMGFFPEHIKMLLSEGNTVELACNNSGDNHVPDVYKDMGLIVHNIPFSRSPFSIDNIRAYKEFKQLIQIKNYDIIHTHTPIASALVRIACRHYRKKGLKVFYTAHGFHFYKGAPVKNWLLYYPVEWICAHWTDVLITINKEDYELAKKRMKAKKVEYVPGVGVDTEKFSTNAIDHDSKRNELGIPDSMTWCLSVGELIKRKNHETLIRAVAKLDNIYLTIAGQGELLTYLNDLIDELHVNDRVKLLGYRTDISELCDEADLFALPSYQEGLSMALMEAMASGKAVVCSRIRGNTDLIDDGKGGFLFDPASVDDMVDAFHKLEQSDRKAMGIYNAQKIKSFDLDNVLKQEQNIYDEFSGGGGGGGYYEHINRLILCKTFRINENDKILMYVAELNKNKNQLSLIDMLAELCNCRDDVKLVLVGQGDYKSILLRHAEELDISDKVVFTGYRKDVPQLLQIADVYVASSIREGLAINVIEAMASGVPIVAYDNRGHRSIIENGVNGFLVKNGDYVQMAKKVNRLLEDKKTCEKFVRSGIKKAQEFSEEVVCDKMREIYENNR